MFLFLLLFSVSLSLSCFSLSILVILTCEFIFVFECPCGEPVHSLFVVVSLVTVGKGGPVASIVVVDISCFSQMLPAILTSARYAFTLTFLFRER